jgi:hypothetical protein
VSGWLIVLRLHRGGGLILRSYLMELFTIAVFDVDLPHFGGHEALANFVAGDNTSVFVDVGEIDLLLIHIKVLRKF